MKTAQINFRKVIIGTIFAAALMYPKGAWAAAGAKVTCNSGTTCTVGEFLYNDSYALDSSASCLINSLYPDGVTTYLNIGVSSPVGAGWYSHSFTAPVTTGYYRTQICCTSGEDYLCLDKSFEVAEATTSPSSDDIAEAVWGYSSRTMSNFGTLATAVWSQAIRTLTGAGLSSGNLATQGDVQSQGSSISSTVATMSSQISTVANKVDSLQTTSVNNQTILELFINKPIIQNSVIEEIDLESKINDTKTTADTLFMNSQYVISRAGLMDLKGKTLSDGELLEIVVGLGSVLGDENDEESGKSIFGQIAWLKNSWNWSSVDDIFDQTKAVKASLTSIETKLMAEGKTTSVMKDIKDLNYFLKTLEKLIGDSTDLTGQKTFFSQLRETKELALVFNSQEDEVNTMLTNWDKNKSSNPQDSVDILFKKVIAINKIPQATTAFISKGTGYSLEKILKNKLLGLRGLITANKALLAKGTTLPLINTWLEEGSMVFKSLVTNPSRTISQKVTLKYYLPSEVKKENIIEVDSGLTASFDSEKNQCCVEGEFDLRPNETITVEVKVADIWVLSVDEINSLRKQTDELSRPLEKTSYFAQGVTLKSDIDVSLDKILALQKGKITPEEKIRTYREAQIELNAVKVKIEKLKELVTQSGSATNFLGFVGGSQTMAVWGLIIILLIGFVFLAVYMRTLTRNENKNSSEVEIIQDKKKLLKKEKVVEEVKQQGLLILSKKQLAKMTFLLVVFGIITAVISGLIVWKITLASVGMEKTELALITPEVKGAATEKEIIKISVPIDKEVDIKETPDFSSKTLIQLESSQMARKLDSNGEWVNVSIVDGNDLGKTIEGWVNKEFVFTE